MIKEIKVKDKVFAVIADFSDIPEGTIPVTHPERSLQMLMMKRKKGHVVSNHMHKHMVKSTKRAEEAVVVIRGEIKAKISDRKKHLIGIFTIKTGQCLMVIDGAHEVQITKNTLLYEFKNGPYIADKIQL
jgi:hypothetical protein